MVYSTATLKLDALQKLENRRKEIHYQSEIAKKQSQLDRNLRRFQREVTAEETQLRRRLAEIRKCTPSLAKEIDPEPEPDVYHLDYERKRGYCEKCGRRAERLIGKLKIKKADEGKAIVRPILEVKTKKNEILASDRKLRKAGALCDTILDRKISDVTQRKLQIGHQHGNQSIMTGIRKKTARSSRGTDQESVYTPFY
ncbi:hypothetical protein CAPTEDRAFT_210137 [Capitella teleta]|uniref:Uncharacterized protein n=1 Tax=Capitella teleta TaxID=283909 RepID=R7U3J8_CAPTE|nr:hypothetical protein CAPTEDRAFT_210137 [Capitella teleta]|eukprot:ELT97745.1 hypothetical protein CAPTEDRAFT_210137 [Capitella teleta]